MAQLEASLVAQAGTIDGYLYLTYEDQPEEKIYAALVRQTIVWFADKDSVGAKGKIWLKESGLSISTGDEINVSTPSYSAVFRLPDDEAMISHWGKKLKLAKIRVRISFLYLTCSLENRQHSQFEEMS